MDRMISGNVVVVVNCHVLSGIALLRKVEGMIYERELDSDGGMGNIRSRLQRCRGRLDGRSALFGCWSLGQRLAAGAM